VIYKDLKGRPHALVTSLLTAQSLGLSFGEELSKDGMSDREVIQKAIDSLPGGGRILIKRGLYDLGEEGLQIPYPSHFFIEGEGFDPYPEVLERVYKDGWSYGGTCLLYRGKGHAIYFGPKEAKKGVDPRATLELSNIAVRVKGGAKSAICLKYVNYAIFECVGVATEGPSLAGISIEGEGGGTKFLKVLLIQGPFYVGLNLFTEHVLVMKAQIEGYRGWAMKLWRDCKVVSAVIRTKDGRAKGGVFTYPVKCPKRFKRSPPPLNKDEHWRASYPVTLVNVFDESEGVGRGYVSFIANGAHLVLVGCGKNPKLKARLYAAQNGGKVDTTAQVLKESRR